MGYYTNPRVNKFNQLRLRVRSQLDKQVRLNARIHVDGQVFHHVWIIIGKLPSSICFGIKSK